MIQVWKCSTCLQTNINPEVIKQHEKKCYLNPNNKGCYTCKHRVIEGAPISGYRNECNKGIMKNNDDIIFCGSHEVGEPIDKSI